MRWSCALVMVSGLRNARDLNYLLDSLVLHSPLALLARSPRVFNNLAIGGWLVKIHSSGPAGALCRLKGEPHTLSVDEHSSRVDDLLPCAVIRFVTTK